MSDACFLATTPDSSWRNGATLETPNSRESRPRLPPRSNLLRQFLFECDARSDIEGSFFKRVLKESKMLP